MSTRLKRPSLLRQLSVTTLLLGSLVYLGFSALTGQFGIESKEQLLEDIQVLSAEKARLAARIEDYNKRIALLDPQRLDPDMLTERARISLSMAHPNDILVILPESN